MRLRELRSGTCPWIGWLVRHMNNERKRKTRNTKGEQIEKFKLDESCTSNLKFENSKWTASRTNNQISERHQPTGRKADCFRKDGSRIGDLASRRPASPICHGSGRSYMVTGSRQKGPKNGTPRAFGRLLQKPRGLC